MFEGFKLERVDVGDAELRVRHGGSGPPVLLLHGHPRTHVTWHKVAPMLAGQFTVVCPDLRGYVRGQPIDCGHHIAEEAPAELARHLAGFFSAA
jgi:haloacetate dehalogenase